MHHGGGGVTTPWRTMVITTIVSRRFTIDFLLKVRLVENVNIPLVRGPPRCTMVHRVALLLHHSGLCNGGLA